MNTTIYTFSELTKTLDKYWEENALQVISKWTFREQGTETKEERVSNLYILQCKIEVHILNTLAEGKYPFFEIDTENAIIYFQTFENLNDIYLKISPLEDPNDIVFPDIITIKTFTQGTTFFWLY